MGTEDQQGHNKLGRPSINQVRGGVMEECCIAMSHGGRDINKDGGECCSLWCSKRQIARKYLGLD